MSKKIVFIGNSIVNGFPMSRGRSFPGLVRSAIKEGKTGFHTDVINKGVNGQTTSQILQRFEFDALTHGPAAVFIMTGTNDFIYREADPDGVMANLMKMARMAETAGAIPVFITPLPVHEKKAERMWMSGFGIDYSQVNGDIGKTSQMIQESGYLYVDAGSAWRAFMTGDAAEAESLVADGWETDLPLQEADAYLDGVHPTPDGYRFLAGVVIRWMEEHAEEIGLK